MFPLIAVLLSIWAATAQDTQTPLQRATELEVEADRRFRQLQWNDVEGLLQDALRIKKSVLGEQHVDTGVLLERLGQFYTMQGRYDAAEPLLRDAARIQRANPDRNEVATATGALGNLYLSQRRFTLAKSTLDDSLRRTAMLSGGGERAHIYSLLGLASYYKVMAEFEHAEQLMLRAKRISEKAFGPAHSNTASVLGNLGLLAYERRDYAPSERYLEESLTILRDANSSYRVAIIEGHLAEIYLRQGKLDEAKSLLLGAIETQRRTFGGPHRALAASLATLGEVCARRSETQDAERAFRESIAMFEKAGGSADTAYIETLERYANLLKKSRRKTEAAAVQTRARTAAGFQRSSSLR